MRDTGVVHQDVDARGVAVGIDAREGSFNRVSQRDVAFQRRGLTPSRANVFDSIASGFEIAIEREDMGTDAGEGRRDRQANPRAGAGANRRLSANPKPNSNRKKG